MMAVWRAVTTSPTMVGKAAAQDAMDQPRHNVFISYARADQAWVGAMVNLLIAGGAKVFMDIRDIAYGDNWENLLRDKLREVERVLVFWSTNAAASRWVAEECAIAIRHGKRLVPVPIDDTPLPDTLARYHALTDLVPLLQQTMGRHPSAEPPPLAQPEISPAPIPDTPKVASKGFGVWAMAAIAALTVVPAMYFLSVNETNEAPTEPASIEPGTVTTPPSGAESGFPWLWFFTAIASIGSVIWLVGLWRRRQRTERDTRATLGRYSPPEPTDEMTTVASPASPDIILGKQVVEMVFNRSD